jgi:hypothetical protein
LYSRLAKVDLKPQIPPRMVHSEARNTGTSRLQSPTSADPEEVYIVDLEPT